MTDEKKLKVGIEIPFGNVNAVIVQMDLPKVTMQIDTKQRRRWVGSLLNEVIEIAGNKFFVKAIAGKRMYLLHIEQAEGEKEGE